MRNPRSRWEWTWGRHSRRLRIIRTILFPRTAEKVYGSRKENKIKTIICHWKHFPLKPWWRDQAYLYQEIPVSFKWKINICRKLWIVTTTSCLMQGTKTWALKLNSHSKRQRFSARNRGEDMTPIDTEWNDSEQGDGSRFKAKFGSLRLSAFWCKDWSWKFLNDYKCKMFQLRNWLNKIKPLITEKRLFDYRKKSLLIISLLEISYHQESDERNHRTNR